MIDVNNLTKKFGDLLVLDDITTSIKEGTLTAYGDSNCDGNVDLSGRPAGVSQRF